MLKKFYLILILVLGWFHSMAQTFEWMRQVGGLEHEFIQETKLDGAGNLYVTGTYERTMEFQPWADSLNMSTPIYGSFLLKYSPDGDLLWAKSWGIRSRAYSVDFDTLGNVYVAGEFHIETNFNPDTGASEVPEIVIGDNDAFVSKFDSTGNFIWVKTWGSENSDDATQVRFDSEMNMYVAGEFRGTVDMDPGAGIFELSSVNNDVVVKSTYLSKFDSDGNFLWSKAYGNRGTNTEVHVIVDHNDNVIVGGDFNAGGDFDPGPATETLTPVGSWDGYVVKFNSDGELLWVNQIGNQAIDHLNAVIADSLGNLYATGRFSGVVDFDPGTTVFELTSNGSSDGFLVKYDALGQLQWVKQWGGSEHDTGLDVHFDGAGNLIVLTNLRATADLDPGPGEFLVTSVSNVDAALIKLGGGGDFIWGKHFGCTTNLLLYGWGLDVADDESIYLSGDFRGTVDFDPSAQDSFMVTRTGSYVDGFVVKLGNCPVVYSSFSDAACNSYESPSGYYTWSESGIYLDVIPASTGCDSAMYINVTINELNTEVVNSGLSLVTQQDTGLFQWLDCNNGFEPILGDTNPEFIPSINGSYAVSIEANGCLDTSSCYSMLTVNVQPAETEQIYIYPNPTRRDVYLSIPDSDSDLYYNIFDSFGRIVISNVQVDGDSEHIDLGFLQKGLYFLVLSNSKERLMFRIIKQ